MPGADVFIDSNVLLYARDEPSTEKAVTAADWLRRLARQSRGRTNLQVLNEVTHVLLRKRQDLSAAQIFAEVDGLRFFGTSALTDPVVAQARHIRTTTRYSWWDCLLVASAIEMRCTHFLSEDLGDRQLVSGSTGLTLTIIDPFAHSPEHILSR